MTHSLHSSSASVSCRLDWRPSRWLIGALLLLGALAACSALMSEMPRAAAWPSAMAALGYAAWRARLESRKPPLAFFFPGSDSPVALQGRPVQSVGVQWRGPLAFVSWRENGCIHRAAWWPDTLPAARRRELRLAAGAADATRHHVVMAP